MYESAKRTNSLLRSFLIRRLKEGRVGVGGVGVGVGGKRCGKANVQNTGW